MVKADKIGLVIVFASLAAIAVIAYLVIQYQHEHRMESIRSQGVSLVRAMSGVPFEQLEPGGMMEDDQFQRLEIAATGELGDFMQRFNRFVGHAGRRIERLEEDQKRLLTSTKLLTYRKNRVETVLETLPEAIVILDESGAITYANQKPLPSDGSTLSS